jgi:hypothetical protein
MKNTLIIIFLTSLVLGCGGSDNPSAEVDNNRISIKKEVDVVFWHEHDTFTFFTENKQTKEVDRIYMGTYIYIEGERYITGEVNLFIDVKEGNNPWFECSASNFFISSGIAECSIHIKDYDHLRTADWNNGKFGAGSTLRVN